MGSFTAYTSPSPLASEDESDDGSSSDNANKDDGDSLPSDDEMSTCCTYPLSLVTKSIGDFCDRGSVYTMRDVVRFLCIFLFFLSHLPHVYWSCDHLTYIVLIFGLYMLMYVIHLSLHMLFLLFLWTCFLYIVCNLLFLFHTKMP